jgi:tripartite-type tricarboxylate transporter receptor subunit TctC
MTLVIFILSALPYSVPAAEEKWPSRPITITIGFAPGGGMDMLGRLLSEEMKKTMGVAMPVVNMVGANSAVAMAHVHQQPKRALHLPGDRALEVELQGFRYGRHPLRQFADLQRPL